MVDMNKLSLVGLDTQKSQILKLLMQKGIVQIDDSADLTENEEIKEFLKRDGDEEKVAMYEQRLSVTANAIIALDFAAKRKKAIFSQTRQSEMLTEEQVEELYSFAGEVNSLVKKVNELKASENVLKNKIEMLVPWAKLDIPLEQTSTKFSQIVLGMIPTNITLESISLKLAEVAPESTVGMVNSNKLVSYIYLIAHNDVYEQAIEVLREFDFAAISFADSTGTPLQAINSYKNIVAESEQKRKELDAELLEKTEKTFSLEQLYDCLTVQRDQINILSKLLKTERAFTFNGWIPANKSDLVKQELVEKFDCCVYTTPGDKKTGIPILLKNNALVEPFESITAMYSLPHSSNVDPNTVVAIFFFTFYGMMLSDAGYGVLMTLACWFVLSKYNPDGEIGKMLRMFRLCGVSTTIWGLVFGSIFGGLVPFQGLLNPLEDVQPLMAMSILFGIAHLYVGLGMKGYMYIRDGNPLAVIWDVISWYLFLTGLIILVAPSVMPSVDPQLLVAGEYMALVGFVILFLTQGRNEKGLFKKAFEGVSCLHGVIGYFGDILSYLRLMALCLSTGVIAIVINLLGEMSGVVLAVIIGTVGHMINLLINALGAYVHTSRLQYVEFFGKFYEGGGTAFKPFKLNTKYVSFREEN